MTSLRLRLFGGFALSARDEGELPIPLAKDRALFAYLALHPGTRFTRGQLAGLLWGDQPEARARHSLSQSLSGICEALGPFAEALERGRKAVALREGAVEVDVAEFRSLCAAGAPLGWLRALEIYQETLLAEFEFDEPAFDEWALALRTECLDLALNGGLAFLAAPDRDGTAELIQVARRLVRLDPCCEAAHQALIRHHGNAGEAGAAIRQYEACRLALGEELGVEPSPETTRCLDAARVQCAAPQDRPEPDENRDRPSLVVLPFANLSGDPAMNYLALGLADDITTELTRFRDLFVIAQDTAFTVACVANDTPAHCRRLGVRHCLRGSLRRTAGGLRINLHLVEGESGQTVWGERYDLGEEELPDLSGQVLAQVVGRLASWLEREALDRARHKPAQNWNAYDHMLQGLEHHNRSWYGIYNTMRAIKHFEQAIKIDPECARAHAYLACASSVPYFKDRNKDRLGPCIEIARHALELDPAESEAHRIMGGVRLTLGEHEASRRHFEEARRIHPGQTLILAHAARYHMHAGEPQEAFALLGRARQLNPMHPPWYWEHVAIAQFVRRDYQGTLDALDRMRHHSFYDSLYAAAANAYLGRKKRAAYHRDFARAKNPRLTLSNAAYYLPYQRGADLDHVVNGLKTAGFDT